MNNDRRKALDAIMKDIAKAAEQFEEAKAAFADIRDAVEAIKDEEQEYFDNMPESIQGGDKGQAAEAAVSQLEEAYAALDEAADFEFDADSVVGYLDEAKA